MDNVDEVFGSNFDNFLQNSNNVNIAPVVDKLQGEGQAGITKTSSINQSKNGTTSSISSASLLSSCTTTRNSNKDSSTSSPAAATIRRNKRSLLRGQSYDIDMFATHKSQQTLLVENARLRRELEESKRSFAGKEACFLNEIRALQKLCGERFRVVTVVAEDSSLNGRDEAGELQANGSTSTNTRILGKDIKADEPTSSVLAGLAANVVAGQLARTSGQTLTTKTRPSTIDTTNMTMTPTPFPPAVMTTVTQEAAHQRASKTRTTNTTFSSKNKTNKPFAFLKASGQSSFLSSGGAAAPLSGAPTTSVEQDIKVHDMQRVFLRRFDHPGLMKKTSYKKVVSLQTRTVPHKSELEFLASSDNSEIEMINAQEDENLQRSMTSNQFESCGSSSSAPSSSASSSKQTSSNSGDHVQLSTTTEQRGGLQESNDHLVVDEVLAVRGTTRTSQDQDHYQAKQELDEVNEELEDDTEDWAFLERRFVPFSRTTSGMKSRDRNATERTTTTGGIVVPDAGPGAQMVNPKSNARATATAPKKPLVFAVSPNKTRVVSSSSAPAPVGGAWSSAALVAATTTTGEGGQIPSASAQEGSIIPSTTIVMKTNANRGQQATPAASAGRGPTRASSLLKTTITKGKSIQKAASAFGSFAANRALERRTTVQIVEEQGQEQPPLNNTVKNTEEIEDAVGKLRREKVVRGRGIVKKSATESSIYVPHPERTSVEQPEAEVELSSATAAQLRQRRPPDKPNYSTISRKNTATQNALARFRNSVAAVRAGATTGKNAMQELSSGRQKNLQRSGSIAVKNTASAGAAGGVAVDLKGTVEQQTNAVKTPVERSPQKSSSTLAGADSTTYSATTTPAGASPQLKRSFSTNLPRPPVAGTKANARMRHVAGSVLDKIREQRRESAKLE
ncbi:unnamed protein product [Amoebophrya sp. A120]|nr:unnamed protein product [Amoebophrya sp. A120]|eukprot:GSA120T00022594001.1